MLIYPTSTVERANHQNGSFTACKFYCWRSSEVTNIFLMALPAHSGPMPLISFRNHFSQTVGLLGRVISQPQGLYLYIEQHKHRINAYTHQASMPWVGFEPTIQASERANTVHALHRAASMTGRGDNHTAPNNGINDFLSPFISSNIIHIDKYFTESRMW
jgi:hypothetical protein